MIIRATFFAVGGAIMASLGVGCASKIGTLKPSSDEFADMRVGVLDQYPEELMFVSSSGQKVGFSAKEFITISEHYIDNMGLRESITTERPRIWIDTSGGKKIADVYYGGRGKWESLVLEIDKDGHVITHKTFIGVCGGAFLNDSEK